MNERQVPTPTTQTTTPAPAQAVNEERQAVLPRVDIVEDEQGITPWADLPGVSKQGLEVKVEGDTLAIAAT